MQKVKINGTIYKAQFKPEKLSNEWGEKHNKTNE